VENKKLFLGFFDEKEVQKNLVETEIFFNYSHFWPF